MSLSYYSNCPASASHHDDHLELDHQLITPDNINYNDHLQDYNHGHLYMNPHQLFDPTDLFFSSENPNHFFPDDFPPDHTFKLQKHYPGVDPVFFDDGLFQNPSFNYLSPVAPPESALPEFPSGPPAYSNGICEAPKAAAVATGLSAQSIAARQRRRKITEKTRELGKIVPGGQKMNTAEMLQAAYKYIKFMQAQVGILEFVGSYDQEAIGADETRGGDLHDLLVSEAIQEKLYSTENCLVPNKFVEEISIDDRMVRDNPQLVSIVKQEV